MVQGATLLKDLKAKCRLKACFWKNCLYLPKLKNLSLFENKFRTFSFDIGYFVGNLWLRHASLSVQTGDWLFRPFLVSTIQTGGVVLFQSNSYMPPSPLVRVPLRGAFK